MKCELCDSDAVCRGYCRKCYERLKRTGEITSKKHNTVPIYDKGVNDTPRGWVKKTKENTKIIKLWYRLLERCYRKEFQERCPTYIGCEMCDEWLTLSVFAEEIKLVDGYDKWLESKEMYSLDKDILGNGNKVYSLNTCTFIKQTDNAKEGQFRNGRQKQVVRISNDGSIKVYESTIAPKHEDGFSQSCVYNCCNGKTKTHRGYKWMFLEDYEKQLL